MSQVAGKKNYFTAKIFNENSDVAEFLLKGTAPMGKLMKKYREVMGEPNENLSFWYRGRRLLENQTPNDIKAVSPCKIRVLHHRDYSTED